MKKLIPASIVMAAVIVMSIIGAGCSSSTDTAVAPPFLLSLTSHGESPTGDLALRFHIALNGTAFPNAHLTIRQNPSNHLDTIASKSDANGDFILQITHNDSVIRRAFQAYSKDTLKSNVIVYP